MAINFKGAGAIAVYIVVSLGLLALAGYNFWGWFGGSDKWKAENPNLAGELQSNNSNSGRINKDNNLFPKNPELLSTFKIKDTEYIYTSSGWFPMLTNNPNEKACVGYNCCPEGGKCYRRCWNQDCP